jgi:trigger factor
LKVTTERQENCMVKLTIAVDEKRSDDLLRRAARALSRRYRLPGFRPGKAPYSVVVQRLGIETIQSQALDQFGDQIFEEGLKESELEPVDQATLENVTWDPFTLHLQVPVAPQVDLGDLDDLRIPWTAPEVTETELEEALERLQQEQAEWREVERPAELGDQVILDIRAQVEGETVLENSDRELILSQDSPYPVPGFGEAVVGMQPGEEREFSLTYPQDHYSIHIAGKEGLFTVKLSKIQVEERPELNDEFAIMVGDYEDLDDLKTKLRSTLQQDAESKAESEYEDQLWAKLFETVSVEYPVVMVDQEVEMLKQQIEQQLQQQQQLDMESYWRLTNTTEEAWKAQVRPQAEERLKRRLILAEVIHTQELKLDDDGIAAEIERLVEPLGENADQMREFLSTPMSKLRITESLLTQQAMERLLAIARGERALKAAPEETEEPAAEPEQEAPASAAEQEQVPPAQEAAADVEEQVKPDAPDRESPADAEGQEQPSPAAQELAAQGETAEAPVETTPEI